MDAIVPMMKRWARAIFGGLLAPICFGSLTLSGCVLLPTMPSILPDEPVRIMNCRWDSNVKVGYDVKHNGAPIVALAAQTHFFGSDAGHPITVHGKVVIEWFDITGPLADNPRPMRPCILEAAALQALQGKSFLGPAYTLVLHWPEYSPEVKRVLITTRFYPANGGDPIIAEPAQITLHGSTPVIGSHSSVPVVLAPGFGLPPATTLGGAQLTGTPPTVSYGPPPPLEMPAINGH
jgi:hypothetical protein